MPPVLLYGAFMISLYFGLPGCGKTTLLSKFALDACRKGRKVYGNIPLAIQGYTRIDNNCVGHYDLSDSLLLIDEARKKKSFRQKKKQIYEN